MLHHLDAARAAYEACRTKYPKKLLYLSQGGRILERSDQPGNFYTLTSLWLRFVPAPLPQGRRHLAQRPLHGAEASVAPQHYPYH